MSVALPIDDETLADFCRRHQIRKLSLFGSTLRGTAGPDSDIDLLVEFLPEARPTLLTLAALEDELGELMGGRKIDLRTPAELSRYFRDSVVRQAEVRYVAR
jgi:predicted nucleotidyltransferase